MFDPPRIGSQFFATAQLFHTPLRLLSLATTPTIIFTTTMLLLRLLVTASLAWSASSFSIEKAKKLQFVASEKLASAFASVLLAGSLAVPSAALAVSGGGLDYAGIDISGQDFSNQNYKGKDFTQGMYYQSCILTFLLRLSSMTSLTQPKHIPVLAKATTFANSNLQGCRFYKAYLVKVDFSGADLRGASLEDTSLDEARFTNTNAAGAYFSSSILDATDLRNADFTDAQFPTKTLPLLCDRPDVQGTHPVTGVDTRESLLCP